eukprot:scaffold1079_cov112-Isochrysis_galbana.AAC.2
MSSHWESQKWILAVPSPPPSPRPNPADPRRSSILAEFSSSDPSTGLGGIYAPSQSQPHIRRASTEQRAASEQEQARG